MGCDSREPRKLEFLEIHNLKNRTIKGEMMILGLCGHPTAGKTEVAKLPAKLSFEKTAFADPLKFSVATALGLDIQVFYDQALKNTPLPQVYGLTPRQLMQQIGTNGYRKLISDRVWIDTWMRRVEDLINNGTPRVVVEDVRFLNERNAVREVGLIVAVVRPEAFPTMTHESEDDAQGSSETQTTPSRTQALYPTWSIR